MKMVIKFIHAFFSILDGNGQVLPYHLGLNMDLSKASDPISKSLFMVQRHLLPVLWTKPHFPWKRLTRRQDHVM